MMRLLYSFICLALLVSIAQGELAPAPLDLTIISGETYTLMRRVKAGGKIADLTGYRYQAQLRKDYGDAQPLAEFATLPGDASGVIRLTLPSTTTTTLNLKAGYWDLVLISPDDSRSFLMRGKWRCLPSATR